MTEVPSVATDHRRSSEPALVAALAAREPLALAEVYHRTVNAAHACAWRLTASTDEVETLLYRTYRDLWEHPPGDEPLEGWVRRHCFALGAGYLADRERPAAAASTAALLPDLGLPPRPLNGTVEQILGLLDPQARDALVRAHDGGLPTWEQEDVEADEALDRALLALAGEEAGDGHVPLLGDWTLGLLTATDADGLENALAVNPAWGSRSRLLRRGRRRVEGLPPHPDMGQRILVMILSLGAEARNGHVEQEPEPPARRPLFGRLLRR